MPPIPTIQRLSNLKPGQVMTYYRGQYPQDVENQDSPDKQIVREVFKAACQLAEIGKIKLREKKEEIKVPPRKGCPDKVSVIRYEAVGVN